MKQIKMYTYFELTKKAKTRVYSRYVIETKHPISLEKFEEIEFLECRENYYYENGAVDAK